MFNIPQLSRGLYASRTRIFKQAPPLGRAIIAPMFYGVNGVLERGQKRYGIDNHLSPNIGVWAYDHFLYDVEAFQMFINPKTIKDFVGLVA